MKIRVINGRGNIKFVEMGEAHFVDFELDNGDVFEVSPTVDGKSIVLRQAAPDGGHERMMHCVPINSHQWRIEAAP